MVLLMSGGVASAFWFFHKGDKVAPERGVTIYDFTLTEPGYILFSNHHGGHVVYLIDRHGNVIHKWFPPKININVWMHKKKAKGRRDKLMKGYLSPDGSIYYLTDCENNVEGGRLYKLDWDSHILWDYPCLITHDFQVLPNNNVMIDCWTGISGDCDRVLKYGETGQEIEHGHFQKPDNLFYLEVNPQKQVVWRWKGKDHIMELHKFVKLEPIMLSGDSAHNNTCWVIGKNSLGERDSRFRPGNIIFSYRNLNTVGVIVRKTGEIVWAWDQGNSTTSITRPCFLTVIYLYLTMECGVNGHE